MLLEIKSFLEDIKGRYFSFSAICYCKSEGMEPEILTIYSVLYFENMDIISL